MAGMGFGRRILMVTGFVGLLAVSRAFADGEDAAYEVVDPEGIYLGTGTHPKTPGVMTADDVWKEIPEYKQIIEDELTEDDPKYHLLMLKATERFNQALKTLAKRESYDMLGEVGAIVAKSGGEIPDVTAEMIKLVTRG
jgi:hypothetical protein